MAKVEELQEPSAEDSGPGQHGRGKRVAEDLQVGMPVKKRIKKAVKKMGLQVEPSREGGVDDAALYEGDRETVVNDDGMDFDEIVEEEVRGGFDLEAMESGDMSHFENRISMIRLVLSRATLGRLALWRWRTAWLMIYLQNQTHPWTWQMWLF